MRQRKLINLNNPLWEFVYRGLLDLYTNFNEAKIEEDNGYFIKLGKLKWAVNIRQLTKIKSSDLKILLKELHDMGWIDLEYYKCYPKPYYIHIRKLESIGAWLYE